MFVGSASRLFSFLLTVKQVQRSQRPAGRASVGVHQHAVPTVVAAVDHGERAVLLLVAESEEGVADQVHLEDRFLDGHAAEGEVLQAEIFIWLSGEMV